MTVAGTKPDPVTVTAAGVAPERKLDGEEPVIMGAGLSTSRATADVVSVLALPFDTVISNIVPVARSVAGTIVVNSVALTKVVGLEVPFT